MSESNQKKLGRVRPPRVHITYDVETGGAIQVKELPFIVGVLADLSVMPELPLPPLRDRKFVEIDSGNFQGVMEAAVPRVEITVDDHVSGTAGATLKVVLQITHMDQLEPVALVQAIDPLSDLFDKRNRYRDFLGKLDGNDDLDALMVDLLADTAKQTALIALFTGQSPDQWRAVDDASDPLLEKMTALMIRRPAQKPYALELIGQMAVGILEDTNVDKAPNDAAFIMNDQIAVIDKMISDQLNEVMHHADFQQLEATWRGLHYLVSNTETGTNLKIKVLNTSKKDVLKDLKKAVEFDQSALFKMVYEAEHGTYGGAPFSCLVGDYEFGRSNDDMELLDKISGVAAAAHAPFITAAYALLFDLEDFSKLSKPRDLSKIFESAELIKWRSFRDSEDSRYVTLAMPRVLLRLPWGGKRGATVEGLGFEEDVKGPDPKKFLWGNAAYVLAQRITNAFSLYGWTAAIRGVEGGGLVEGLPAYVFETADGDLALTCPTEISITDRREKELNDLGFMAICHCKGTDKAAFFGGQTTNNPKVYNTDSANANARISGMLPYVMAASRFAHYIKAIMREKIGSFLTKGNVEEYLNTWIAQYVLLDDSAPQAMKARFPLREARVDVTDVPGKPGSYRATVFLKPHFQLEELTASIRLVAELPA